jgi:hypothetical protein
VSFAVNLMALYRETGSVEPCGKRHGKLDAAEAFLLDFVARRPDVTVPEQNWIKTLPGRGWFTYFRLYGPTQAYFDKSWLLPDIQRM